MGNDTQAKARLVYFEGNVPGSLTRLCVKPIRQCCPMLTTVGSVPCRCTLGRLL